MTTADQYLIKPDNHSLRAFKGIEAIPFSFAVAPLLDEALVQEIIVDTKESVWRIKLLLQNQLPAGAAAELETALASLVLGLSRVELVISYLKDLPPLGQRLDEYWNQFCLTAGERFPGATAWLSEARYTLTSDNRLELQVRNKIGVEYLAERREALLELLNQALNTELQLELVVGDFGEPLPTEAEEETEAAAAALRETLALKSATGKKNQARGGQVIYGRKISSPPLPLGQLQTEVEQVVVAGEIFRWETRLSKNGQRFYLGDLTDYQDSIGFKLFPRRGPAQFEEEIHEGDWVLLRGRLQFDSYTKELALMVTDINRTNPPLRLDQAPQKRIELHLHTKMSALDATADVTAAVQQAALWGHPALAITDHGVVQAFPEAYAASQKYGVQVIYGMEGYLVDDGVAIVSGATDQQPLDTSYVVFDVETTGLNPWQEDLLEIGAVKLQQGKIVAEFHSMVRPEKEISPEIQKLTGITPEMVREAPLPAEALKDFLEFATAAVLVAHNAQFDMGFLKAKCQLFLGEKFQAVVVDTLPLARSVWPEFKSFRLDSLAKELQLTSGTHHRADADARCTAQLLLAALAKIGGRGFSRLAELNSLIKEAGVEHLKPFHITLLVKEQIGLKNLYRLVSESHLKYFHRQPRIPRSRLAQLREGLLLGSACESGEFYQAILEGAAPERLRELAAFYDYLEIQPLANNQFLIDNQRVATAAELIAANQLVCQIGAELGIPVVATGDVHFLQPHEEVLRRILQFSQGYADANRQAPLYFKTTEQMLQEFDYLGPELARAVVIEHPQSILKQVATVRPVPEGFYPPLMPEAEAQIREMSYRHAREWYGDPLPQLIQERLEWELKSIINHGYAVLYLIAQKLVKKSLDDGYLVGSRGSVGSSFVALLCGITEVNPLPAHYRCPNCLYSQFVTGVTGSGFDLPDQDCPQCGSAMVKDGQDIPFATFMGFEGDKEPDIDLNFSGEYQAKVHRYTEELFGKGYVFRAGTITGLADKMAFGFVRGYLEDRGLKPRQAEINRLVKGCTGVRRSTGQHPGGMVVVPQDQEIYNFTPIQYPANDRNAEWITTHFDFHGALEGRLVKLDILGHDDPTVIRMLHDLTGVDPRSVPLDDPATLQLFSSVEPLGVSAAALGCDLGTLGIPEFGTGFVRQMLAETRPTTFSELVYLSGLSHGTNVWLGNAQDLIKNGQAKLAEVISTRDDIMNYLIQKDLPAQSSFKIMEKVRRGRGLDPDDIQTMQQHQVPDWYIESCQKIKYMFPKAHATAYVMMAFRIAYYKVKYPEAFYATYFSVRADEFDAETVVHGEAAVRQALAEMRSKGNDSTQREKNLETILEVVLEAMLRGIVFRRVDIYQSDPKQFLITPAGLLPPLASLQGLGDNAATALAAARTEGPFLSVDDLKTRARLSSAVIEVLTKHGCLTGMSSTDQLELFAI